MIELEAVVPHKENCDALINFEEVKQLATIDELAGMLGLKTKPYNAAQIRCACLVHGGDEKTLAISPAVRSKRGSPGVFFCQKAKNGGDRIGFKLSASPSLPV